MLGWADEHGEECRRGGGLADQAQQRPARISAASPHPAKPSGRDSARCVPLASTTVATVRFRRGRRSLSSPTHPPFDCTRGRCGELPMQYSHVLRGKLLPEFPAVLVIRSQVRGTARVAVAFCHMLGDHVRIYFNPDNEEKRKMKN